MRRTNGNRGNAGLSAAFKGMAIVLAVGMLAVVAGKAAYTSEAAHAAPPAHALAVGPSGIAAPEFNYPEPPRTMAAPAPDEQPVATF